jgi:hypothetical protein
MISTCWLMAPLSAGYSRPTPRLWEAHGCGRSFFLHQERRTPTHGYAATREEAMAAFAKSWRREYSWNPTNSAGVYFPT